MKVIGRVRSTAKGNRCGRMVRSRKVIWKRDGGIAVNQEKLGCMFWNKYLRMIDTKEILR